MLSPTASGAEFIIIRNEVYQTRGLLKNEHRTPNIQRRMMYSVNLKKAEQSKLPVEIRFACLGQAQAPRLPARRGESFDPELTTDRLVTGCCALVLKSIKRSIINIRHSTLDVRCSTFNLFLFRSDWTLAARVIASLILIYMKFNANFRPKLMVGRSGFWLHPAAFQAGQPRLAG